MSLTLLKRLVPNRLKLYRYARFGKFGWILTNVDRRLLQEKIMPWYASRSEVKTVIDIGVEWYNASYYRYFPEADFYTIDFLPEMAKHGRDGFHHTMSVTDLRDQFEEDSVDLILCNGPIGWGLNTREDILKAMEEMARALRPGGYLVVGWNDREENRPGILPNEAAEIAGFVPHVLPSVGESSLLANEKTSHRYEFYQVATKSSES